MARPEGLRGEEEAGRINIAKDVISTIAALVVAEIPGVFAPTGDAFSQGAVRRHVDTELLGGRVRLAMRIAVEYGRVVPELVQELQEKVKFEVERMTALPVEAVDVEVCRVVGPKEGG
jgi:uncharacterized alkaline shock family protein YloU